MNKHNSLVFLSVLIFIIVTIFTACVKELKPLPQADFAYTSSAACQLPMTVSFENLSQFADVYRWDFGDGSPLSFSESPIHVYATEGVYNVTLTTYGPGGTHENMLPVYVVTTPITTFFTNDTLVATGDSVHFFSTTNSSLPSTWLWSFGDGYTSTLENPVHAYSYPGTYTVILTATNACGATYSVQNNYVVVSNPGMPPVPDFTANVTTINTGGTVNFTDLTLNNPNAWEWTFEGGTPYISNDQHPIGVTYNTPGTFQVKLKVFNTMGFDSITKAAYITVVPSGTPPVANFIANVTNITAGGSVNFTDLSINSPTSWQWQFQGGTPNTSNLQNPAGIVYNTPGSYNVTLTATNAQGSDVMTKQLYINVTPSVVTQVSITKITVENMPFGMPPTPRNPYYHITNPNDISLRNGRNEALYGIIQMNLPISWVLTPFYVVPNMNMFLRVHILDRKATVQQDIPLGYVQFRPSDYTAQPNPYPPSITLQQNNLKIIIDLLWQ